MKTLLLLFLVSTSVIAAPYGNNIPLPINAKGDWKPQPRQYTISYDSFFGGHWQLRGRRQTNSDGSFTDTISGTVSNTTIHGTFTQSDFTWLADTSWLTVPHIWIPCSSFSITISGGNVTGTATYTP